MKFGNSLRSSKVHFRIRKPVCKEIKTSQKGRLKLKKVNFNYVRLDIIVIKSGQNLVSFFHDQNDKSKLTQLTSRDMMRDHSFAANIKITSWLVSAYDFYSGVVKDR